MAIKDEITGYMESLEGSFQPSKAEGLEAVIQVSFLDSSIDSWYIEISENKCAVQKGHIDNPTITVGGDPKIFLDIQKGKIMANMAVSRGKMQLSGDLSLAFRIGSCFDLPRGLKFQ